MKMNATARPKMASFPEIVVKGTKVKIFVLNHVKGDTTAFLFKFMKSEQVKFFPKSRLRYTHVMQFTPDLETLSGEKIPPCWSIVDILNPIRNIPVDSVTW